MTHSVQHLLIWSLIVSSTCTYATIISTSSP
jgi:hypothetical protein